MGTNAHDIWDYVASVGGKTCVIDCHPVFYVWTRCTTVCFNSAELLDAIIETMPSHLVLAKCVGCGKLGHTLLACPVGRKKSVPSSALLQKTFLNSDKSRLAAIYAKHLAPVTRSVSFGGVSWTQIAGGSFFPSPPVQNVLLRAGFFSEIKPTMLVSSELNDRFATLECSFTSLAKCVNMLAMRLDTPKPTNQGVDIVISKGSGVATGNETVVFTSGLESGYLGAGVVVVMNSSLAKHVCKVSEVSDWHLSIKLLFKNNLSVSILGLYAGASLVAQFSQAGNINSLIAKAVNESSFVILGSDFNEDGSHKCASFKKCLDFGLVNALGGSSCKKSPTWSNSRNVVKTIDYVLISLNLINVVVGRSMFGVEKYFNTDHQTVLVLAKFKDDMAANAAMLHDDFLAAGMHSNLDAMWVALHKVLCLSAEAVFKKKWFKNYDHVFVKESSKFHKLKLLVSKLGLDSVNASMVKSLFLSVLSKVRKLYHSSKMSEAECVRKSRIRSAIDKRIESFELNKDHTIRNVLEHPFYKVTLDHLVMDNKLVLEPDLVKTKTRKHNVVSVVSSLLEYIFDDAFFDVICPIDFDKMSSVISNLSDGKVAGFFVSMIPKPYEWKSVLMNTHPIVLIKMAHKIFSKILSDRIFFVCSKFNVLRGNNFSVLKGMTTQSPIFAIGSVIKDALEKNSYDSVGWEHLRESLVKIKMCNKLIWFFGGIHNGWVHDGLDQGEVFSFFLWRIFYDPLLCEVKKQGSVCVFVNDTIWVSNSQTATQHILNVTSEFFWINNISINNDKTIAISINCRVSEPCLLISGLPILIAKKGESYWYLGIFLSIEGLSKPSLTRAHLDVRFFTNLVLRKTVFDKQFLYLVSAVLYPIIAYRTQFSFDTIIHKSLKSKFGLPHDFPNNAIHHPFLYGLKSFEQIQAKSKSASVVGFTNSVGILDYLFAHRSHDLQVLSWHPRHLLLFPSYININPSNNFLASIVRIFLECNFSLSGLIINAFHFPSGTLMSVILGELIFYNCKKLDFWGPVPYWFDVSVHYLNDSGLLFICNSLLPYNGLFNILKSHEFKVVCNRLLRVDSGCFFLFTNSSLSGLGTLGIKTGAAVFFEDINLGLGAIALALKCVLPSYSVNLFSDSQAALDHCHIANVIRCKNLNVNWVKVKNHSGVLGNKHADAFTEAVVFSNMCLSYMINEHFLKTGGTAVSGNSRHFVHNIFQSVYHACWEVGSGSRVLVNSLCADVNWSKSSLALHHCLLVAVHKHLYNKSYPSVICLFCGDVKVSDHVFSCPFDAAGCAWLVEVYVSTWEACSGLSRSFSCVSQLLSTWYSSV
ncbi:hypothetical protein G9A89_006048 [Geosiphon pyriformis]|nr:hypothetical protein G9A89_006048 [Geosiphon pyriformis]